VIRLIERFGSPPIKERVREGMPFGHLHGDDRRRARRRRLEQETLDLLDVTVRRNAFGEVESPKCRCGYRCWATSRFPPCSFRAP